MKRQVLLSLAGLWVACTCATLLRAAAPEGAAPQAPARTPAPAAPASGATGVMPVRSSQRAPAVAAAPAQDGGMGAAPAKALIGKYCVTCHSARLKSGGLSLTDLDPADVGPHAETWEKVVRKIKTGAMPPGGMPRPDGATTIQLTSWLEGTLDKAAPVDPGRPLLRRLNRAEYANAVRDLLDLKVDVRALLPPDDSAFGFDNVGDLLTVSPALLERYLDAADRVSALAVGDPATAPGAETYQAKGDQSQDRHREGLPFGTVGGMAVTHNFALDGEYQFNLGLLRTNLEAIRGMEHQHQIEIAVDGVRVFLGTVGGPDDMGGDESITIRSDAIDARLQARVPVKAGPHVVTAAFIQKQGQSTNRLRPFLRSNSDTYEAIGRPHIERMIITGPFNATGPGDTPSRRRVFSCQPGTTRATEDRCATQILTKLAQGAYRRPVGKSDLDRLMPFYRSGREAGTFDTGIQLALRRILASPTFVFRTENDPAGAAPGTTYAVSDVELATRLSFFLWSSSPDDTLLDLAARGQLRTPRVLDAQVRRMIADPKAAAFVENFAGQWLHLRNLANIAPNSDEFPDFDNDLRESFRKEAELFFDSVMREDRSVLDLMTANYTFVNERLARHYGIPGIYGPHFRRVSVTQDARRGLLGKGSVLMATSHSDRTAPVLRGKWIMENVLGSPPPAPPPNVPPLQAEPGAAPKTMRERMELHRANPACASCHKAMDPIGFAMENLDAVGAWRTLEAGAPIDASGQLTDGTAVNGVVDLRQALLRRPEIFVSTLTEKLMIFALGRGLQPADMPVVRRIVREAGAQDYRFSAIVGGIVHSAPFRLRTTATPVPAGIEARAAGAVQR